MRDYVKGRKGFSEFSEYQKGGLKRTFFSFYENPGSVRNLRGEGGGGGRI